MAQLSFTSKEEIEQYQYLKLVELLHYLKSNSPFYQHLFEQQKINVSEIRSLKDLIKLPITNKEDLQKMDADFLCVDKNKIIEYASTSGTLGHPVTIALTENDLQRLSTNEYNSFVCADGSENDIYQLMLTLDRQFMAGIAYYNGLRKLGAGIIRLGPGVPSLQWETIHKLSPTAIVAVPSFILKLVKYAKENNIDPNKTSIKKAICIGENIRNTDFSYNVLAKKILESWNIHLYSTYASTEMQTAFTECSFGNGGHLQPDLLIVELLDENNQPVPENSAGEVTITTLGVEGMPLLRYKTGDICMKFESPCHCGRTSLRLSPIIGRRKQMIKFKGTTLYPAALFDLLSEMKDIHDFVVEVSHNEIGMDEVLIYILPAGNSKAMDHRIRAHLQASLRVSPQLAYVSEKELVALQMPEAGRKAIKLIDKRKD